MEQAILASAKEHFEREGYVMFQNELDHDLMQEAKAHIAYLIANNPGVRRRTWVTPS